MPNYVLNAAPSFARNYQGSIGQLIIAGEGVIAFASNTAGNVNINDITNIVGIINQSQVIEIDTKTGRYVFKNIDGRV